ncbi:prepilin peptidase [Patescibacteria group bacterium]
MAIFYFPVFLLGLTVGSFLNSVIHRLYTKESVFVSKDGLAKSYCPHCKHKLSWQDLIPLISFFFLNGKCRYCEKKISFQYPLIEFSTGILFVLVFQFTAFVHHATIGNFFFTLYLLFAVSALVVVFVYDLKHFIIPDRIIYPAIVVTFVWYILSFLFLNVYSKEDLVYRAFAAFVAATSFLVIVLISKGKWMGLGDPKLAFFMGFLLGFPDIFVALFLAFFIGAIIGVGLILLKRKTMKSEVPFGPFLVGGTVIALFFGEHMINWYLNLFLQNGAI